MSNAATELRILRMARKTAKVCVALRQSGDSEGANRLAEAASQAAELMRQGKL